MKRAPGANRAFYPDTPTHERHQLGDNRKPETRASVAAGHRAIGLDERLKDGVLLGRRNANPRVGNRHV